jgi:hypothetical protein
MKPILSLAAVILLAAAPQAALAWGSTGHRILGEAAMRALPGEAPGFLRTPQAAMDVGEFSREPDRVRGAGAARDKDRDQGHFLDLDDDGKALGGPPLSALPPTLPEYDAALHAVGQDAWKAGFLPYSIVESYQKLARDFAYWRALDAAGKTPAWRAHKAWFAADRRRREAQILADIGDLSHYVGDGSQPLHVTVHFNGWGRFPNPNGYTTAAVHGPFEQDLVRATVTQGMVVARLAPLKDCGCPIQQRVADYLAGTGKLVIPFYEMEKTGGLADGRGTALAAQQIAVGASELRDLIMGAWKLGATESVGWKPVPVADIVAGKVDAFNALYGVD